MNHAHQLIRDRFRGCLLGGAVGDALGAPVEFMSRSEMLERFGAAGLTRYAPAWGGIGRITDDTQMTLFTAEGLLQGWTNGCCDGAACLVQGTQRAYLRWLRTQYEDPEVVVAEPDLPPEGWLLQHPELHHRRGPGQTCLAALNAARRGDDGADNDRKGCGGVMRVAPVGLFFWRPDQAFSLAPAFHLATRLAGLTHGHPTGQLPAGVLAVMVLALVDGLGLTRALGLAKSILLEQPGHEETLLAIEKAEALAGSEVPPAAAVNALGQGWIAEEALAIAIYCAFTAESFAEGVIRAVNHDGDSDSTGAITGHLLGALHGTRAIPADWLEPLELRAVIIDMADRLLDYWAGPSGGERSPA
jgi:ADP-ribosylglycohydrolase